MSCSKPVIACKVGGVPEIVINGWNGLFSDPEDPINLAQKIIYLVEHPEKRTEFGINARNCVENKFTKEALAADSIKYYRELIDNSAYISKKD
jgi:glycosyltransferase involved in cell wall biosynthesis